MIESINNNGGGGGGVQTIVAGTGISVDNTDPENPIVTNTVTDTDDKVRVSVNDTTAGYLNGKLVAGTGIGLTENNNGGNETLTVAIGNHDASLITTGTVATARLGTGTANSTTYLRGDQTWASVAAGDTTYTVTTADCENTTTQITVASFVVPANTWSDGQCVELTVATHALQNSGSTNNWTATIGGTGITDRVTPATTISNATYNYRNVARFRFYREGSTVTYTFLSPQSATQRYFDGIRDPFDTTGALDPFVNNVGYDSSVDFTTNITIYYRMQWSVANASSYVRIVNARAVKYNGGNV